jgi:hypothetical protein
MKTLQALLALHEAKYDHGACVNFVEGWVDMGDAEDMAREGATLGDIMKQFWGDVDDDNDRKTQARKIGLTKTLARDIMSNTLDNHDIELGHARTDEQQIDDVEEPGWYAVDASTGKVVEGPCAKKSDLTALVRDQEGGAISITQITTRDLDEEVGAPGKASSGYREKLISRIEGFTGTLESVPYNKISTEDLEKILDALKGG